MGFCPADCSDGTTCQKWCFSCDWVSSSQCDLTSNIAEIWSNSYQGKWMAVSSVSSSLPNLGLGQGGWPSRGPRTQHLHNLPLNGGFRGAQNWMKGFCQRHSPKMEQVRFTPPKFNMEPEDHGFQKDFPFPGTFFRFHVKFRGCIFLLWVVMFGGQQPSKRKCHGNRSEKTYFTKVPPLSTQKKYCVTQIHCETFWPFQQRCFSHPKSFPNNGMTETPKYLPP